MSLRSFSLFLFCLFLIIFLVVQTRRVDSGKSYREVCIEMQDSIKALEFQIQKSQSTIDSLEFEIRSRESMVDSLKSLRSQVIVKTQIIVDSVRNLGITEGTEYLKQKLRDYENENH